MNCTSFFTNSKIFSVIYSKVFGELLHFAVLYCVDSRHIAGEHINLRCFFNGFDKPEGFVHSFAGRIFL